MCSVMTLLQPLVHAVMAVLEPVMVLVVAALAAIMRPAAALLGRSLAKDRCSASKRERQAQHHARQLAHTILHQMLEA
jgi:hypothetical protein